MFRRLLIGLVLGLVIGGLVAAALVLGPLKVAVFEGAGGLVLAYVAAAVVGTVTGLIAGKPIWASNGKVEAGLKAFFGALAGAGAMFALRQWAAGWTTDLSFLAPGGVAAVGSLPAASLPLIAATLGALFELDNTGEKAPEAKPGERKRIAPQPRANGAAKARGSDASDADDSDAASAEAEVVSKRSKR